MSPAKSGRTSWLTCGLMSSTKYLLLQTFKVWGDLLHSIRQSITGQGDKERAVFQKELVPCL